MEWNSKWEEADDFHGGDHQLEKY